MKINSKDLARLNGCAKVRLFSMLVHFILTFITLRANSADDNLIIFFSYLSQKIVFDISFKLSQNLSQKIVFDISCKLSPSIGDNLHEISKPIF